MVQTIDQTTTKLTFAEYLVYQGKPNVLYELYRGTLIEMAAPTALHTRICEYVKAQILRYLVAENLPLISLSHTGVRTEENSSRIPDVIVFSRTLADAMCERGGAGVLDFDESPVLVVEVTSDNWRTDYTQKKAEYALLNIPEYWIIDPNKRRMKLCTNPLNEDLYEVQDFVPGQRVRSLQLPRFELDVTEVLLPPWEYDIIKKEQQAIAMERQRAEAEHQRAEVARQQAEAASQKATPEYQRAEVARQQAEAERQRAAKLAEKLCEMGVNPDDI